MTHICHRCGIQLASQQSLQYHLNKKTKCNSLKCEHCAGLFPNKDSFFIHKAKCGTSEEEEEKRHKHFDLLTQNDKNVVVLEFDKSGMIKYISKNIFFLLGYNPEEMINKNGYEFIYTPDIPFLLQQQQKYNITGKWDEKNISQYRKIHKNGKLIWFEASQPKELPENKLISVIFEHNIDERKNLEQKSMIGEIVTDHEYDYVFQCSDDGIIRYANSSLINLLKDDNIFNYNIKQFFDKTFKLETGTYFCSIKSINNEINIPTECTVKYYEKYKSFTGIFKKYTINKDELFRSFVHELRNPINSLCQGSEYIDMQLKKSFTSVTKETRELYEEQFQMIHMNQKTSISLIKNLLNDFLDFEKFDMNTFQTNINEKSTIKKIINTVKSIIKPFLYFEEKEIIYNCHSHCDTVIQVDSTRISQILINLLLNAIKYGIGNVINVDIIISDSSVLILNVNHNGNIERNHIEFVFDPFYRINMRKNDGTGLGLYICKRIIEKMNGTIKFQTENNMIDVIVAIPIIIDDIKNIIDLLIVDDFTGIRSTKLILESYGFNVELVKTGEQAIETCKTKTFDIIIMDKNMNGLSGIETVNILRSELNYKGIIYGFTGDTMCSASQSFDCSPLGVNDILYKPLEYKKLIKYYKRDSHFCKKH